SWKGELAEVAQAASQQDHPDEVRELPQVFGELVTREAPYNRGKRYPCRWCAGWDRHGRWAVVQELRRDPQDDACLLDDGTALRPASRGRPYVSGIKVGQPH